MAVKLYTSRTWLWRQYVEKGLSAPEIAKLCGVTTTTIDRYIKKFGLQRSRRSWTNES